MSANEQKTPGTWPLLPPPLEVPAQDPFANDRLQRQAEVHKLMVLVEHASTPLVLCLDAAWGSGKTTFVRMWRQTLENKSYRTILFNAWETDFIAEPLVALVGEVAGVLPIKTKAARTAQQKLKSATGLILRKTTPIAVRLLTAGLFNIRADDLRGLSLSPEDLEKAIGEAAEKVAETAVDQYKRHRNEVEAFRGALRRAVDIAADGKPLVFFVDELDRCRPTFAVELLERVKHLFEVPGVLFVLSVHREQLAHALKAIYGHDFDADGYLGRFFDITYRLADSDPTDYAKYLVAHTGFSDWSAVADCLAFVMAYLHLPLRQQQRCAARTALILRVIGSGQRGDEPAVYSTLLVVREWDPTLYRRFLTGEKTADDVLEALEAVEPDRWQLARETREIEVELLLLESERRVALRGEDRQSPRWESRRLSPFKRELEESRNQQPENEVVLSRGARVLRDVTMRFQSERSWQRRRWRDVLTILELGAEFQILGERPAWDDSPSIIRA